MNDMPLSFYVQSINDAVDNSTNDLKKVLNSGKPVTMGLVQIITDLQAELLFQRDTLKDEIKKREGKKFWQFWK
jgi:hypothetical protein